MTVETATRIPDFTGYATRFNRECTDGRTIRHGAFLHQDAQQVPLVWQHQSKDLENVLGHAVLYHREDGVYTEAFFNETARGQHARLMVEHGDVKSLSIAANNLEQRGADVMHGNITEVSLVYRGANPEAYIQDINLRHSADGSDTMTGEVIIYSGDEIQHAAIPPLPTKSPTIQDVVNSMSLVQRNVMYALIDQASGGSAIQHSDDEDLILHAEDGTEINVTEVLGTLTPLQHSVVEQLVDTASKEEAEESNATADDASAEEPSGNTADASESSAESQDKAGVDAGVESNDASQEESSADESVVPSGSESGAEGSENFQHNQEGSDMTYKAFDSNAGGTAVDKRKTLSHSDISEINTLAHELGSYKKAVESFVLEHADYGITDIDILFPDARATSTSPELIARQTEWVAKVLGATKSSPLAKIKTVLADLTAEEARAKGYVKGTVKKDEVVPLMQRTTSPTTVYKKQKLDRDDIIDITDLDVVTWLKWEIRFMLNEEIARAILIGDGRAVGNPDKIKDPQGQLDGIGIRSVANDHDLYAHKVQLAANVAPGVMIDEITRSRSNYRGSGSPTFYTTDSVLTELLLLKDKMGRRLYETEAALAAAIRVKEIVAVEVMEEDPTLLGIIVNLIDYTVGTNKGGEVTMFDDFDIDFNQYKYLMETRCSGALTKPKSALIIRRDQGTQVTATAPSFNSATNTLTIPATTGVDYLINGVVAPAGDVVITETTDVSAEPQSGYYLAPNSTRFWTFTYTA